MSVTFRFAGKKEAEFLADLSRQTFYDTFASQNTREDMDKFMNEQFTKEALMKEVENKENIFLLASVENEIAGYVKMTEGKIRPEFAGVPSIEIARIYAVNKMIGKGVGSALIQKCFDIALEMKKQWIWLGVWKENKVAIDFYKRWGFEIFGEQDFLLGNDPQKDWLMKKSLM